MCVSALRQLMPAWSARPTDFDQKVSREIILDFLPKHPTEAPGEHTYSTLLVSSIPFRIFKDHPVPVGQRFLKV